MNREEGRARSREKEAISRKIVSPSFPPPSPPPQERLLEWHKKGRGCVRSFSIDEHGAHTTHMCSVVTTHVALMHCAFVGMLNTSF